MDYFFNPYRNEMQHGIIIFENLEVGSDPEATFLSRSLLVSDGVKLGQLLCDADIITKRQLSKALQAQVKGNKGTIGEILVEMGFCDFEDITDALMNSSTDTKQHEEKHEEIHNEPIQPEVESKPKEPEPKKEEPIEISEDKVMGTKFTMSIQTLSP